MLKEERNLGWHEIASYFPNRTLNACQFRWRRLAATGARRQTAQDKPVKSKKKPKTESPVKAESDSIAARTGRKRAKATRAKIIDNADGTSAKHNSTDTHSDIHSNKHARYERSPSQHMSDIDSLLN